MRGLLTVVLVGLVVAAGGCGGSARPQLTVFAASSLTEAVTALADAFGAAADADVRVATAGSQQLARQLLDGADADVFVSADDHDMTTVAEDRGVLTPPVVLATTRLVLVRSATATPAVTELADLAGPSLTVALAAPEVPLGRYTRRLLADTGVDVDPVTLEPSARATLTRVTLGDVDAAVVYAADAASVAHDVEVTDLPRSPTVRYPAAILADTAEADLARDFLAFVRSPDGAAILTDAGLESA